jgi:hypothetical protein
MGEQKQALIIKTTGETEVVSFTNETEYDTIKKAVGGYIEIVRLSPTIIMWVNEEGKLDRLPYNHKATALWNYYIGSTDVMVGSVVITGGTDDEGYCLSLSLTDSNKIQTLTGSIGQATETDLALYEKTMDFYS